MPSFIQWPIHPMTHSPMPPFTQWLIQAMLPFTQWLIQPMALFTNAFIHSITHSPNDPFTIPSFIQWPIHLMSHSGNAPIHQCPYSGNAPIQPMTHSGNDLIHQCPHSFNEPFTQWLIQPMPPFTMCCSANKERGNDCSMQYASTPVHMCEQVAATDLWCRALCLLAACIKTIPVSDTMLSEDVTMTSFTQWLIYPMASFTNGLIYSMTPFTQWLIYPMVSSINALI